MTPEWMKTVEIGPCKCCTLTAGKKKNFIQKTISGILHFFEESLISEEYARRKGLLQSIDPRVKLVSILILIFAVSMTQDIWVLLVVYFLTIFFAYSSKIELSFFMKRVWVFVPIFAGIIMIPIMFNIFLPGTALVTLVYLGNGAHLGPFALPETISITYQGVYVATRFVLRVAACVSLAVLLFLTTPRDLLFKSLRTLKVPKVYVLTLDMCYRYIFLFMDMIKDFYTAKKSRTIKALPMGEEQKWVANRVGYTLVKSLDMSERIHGAMMSRGFKGEVKLMHNYNIHKRDYVALVSVLFLSVFMTLISQNILRF